ncbi:MAG: M48 family metallopeptidase [Omnitrophica WOR_2 bacterium]
MHSPVYNTTAYRYPNERLILAATVILVFLVIAFTAVATVCLSVVAILTALLFSYGFSRSQHNALIQQTQAVTPQNSPVLVALARQAAIRLQVQPVEIFIAPSRILNAYTFGLSATKTIVLHSALLDRMDHEEMQFILGHEMGHVRLGHTWLNSLVGGMAGIPSPSGASMLLTMAFLGWNRACEYSADRAGVLACNNPKKAMTALLKLQAGSTAYSQASLERAIQVIAAQEHDSVIDFRELLATHPMIARRIDQLQHFAASSQYQNLQAHMNQNLKAYADE